MKPIFYILIIGVVAASCQNKNTAESVSMAFTSKIKENKSWNYNMKYRIMHLGAVDTLNFYTNCRLVRSEPDTIFGGAFWIKNDSVDLYYDLKHIYSISHRDKKITRFFPHMGQDWAVRRNTFSGVIDSYFLRTNRFSKLLVDSTIAMEFNDTVVHGEELSQICFRPDDTPPFEQQKKTFYFGKNNELNHITYSVKFQEDWQYNEWHFSNQSYNSVSLESLANELDSLKKSYIIEDYRPLDPSELEPLRNGLIAPNISGSNRQTGDSVKLSDYKGKIVVLDFWYKDCHHCIEAMDAFNKLTARYAPDDLVILGLNPYDGIESKTDKLDKFLESHEMNYPTIFIDKNVAKKYNVLAYPTFYVVDSKGKIKYSKVGYSPQGEQELDSLLQHLIN